MNNYVAPRRDIHFLLNDCFGIDNGTDFSEVYGNLTSEEVNAIIYAYSDFAEKEVAPINFSGDQEGAQWNDGAVTTPKGFKESYRRYIEQGWASLVYPSEFGGQELTTVLRSVHNEIFSGSNMAWSCYVGLSQFATSGIEANGNESQKHRFLPKMVAGNWTGTMCLTESHCGSDLGLIRTKANPRGDGTYSISGTKIFISGGEHDLSENIVNLVLARVEGAANGVKGLSLFIVPKFKVDDHGVIKERNSVNCLSIEHKMGIHANATCVLNFQDAEGILLGNEGDGLKGMFVCMNQARIGTALQALGTADAAFQKALAYSKERTQMRSLTSPNLKADADRIIVHPDVRRMLLIQKSLTEGGRAFTYYISLLLSKHEISNQRDPGLKGLIDISTPICKGFMTEIGIEVATLSVQIYGGHGYIQESKVEQLLRDVRITTIYEGTTGIQGLDLFVKKVLGTNGNLLKDLFLNFDNLIKNARDDTRFDKMISSLDRIKYQMLSITERVGHRSRDNPNEACSVSTDFLMASGYLALGYLWVYMAKVAKNNMDDDVLFFSTKIKTAEFYIEYILPRCEGLLSSMNSGAGNLMSIDVEAFRFS